MEIEGAFHEEMVRIYEEATKFGYRPAYFLQMVEEMGGLGAARQLLRGSKISYGLQRLYDEGRLDISMEALILQDPWSSLFTEAELAQAKQRLDDLGYVPRTAGCG